MFLRSLPHIITACGNRSFRFRSPPASPPLARQAVWPRLIACNSGHRRIVQPNSAISCISLAPFSAASVAPILRRPWQFPGTPAEMHCVSEPIAEQFFRHWPAVSRRHKGEGIGRNNRKLVRELRQHWDSTTTPFFAVLITNCPLRICWRPNIAASPRRRPVNSMISSARRSRVPHGHHIPEPLYLLPGPWMKALCLRAGDVLDALRRGPFSQARHSPPI